MSGPAKRPPLSGGDDIREAHGNEAGRLIAGSALASDVNSAALKRDAEVIEACEQAGVAMVFTKHRHFRH